MSAVINGFMELPLWGCAAIALFLVLVVFGRIFGGVLLWVMSAVPFLLGKVFRGIYLALELPVSALHKSIGGMFGKVDDQLSQMGEKLDAAISRWYAAWHSSEKCSFGRNLLIYMVCTASVALPSIIGADSRILRTGERIYSSCEAFPITRLQRQEWYVPEDQAVLNQEEQSAAPAVEYEETETFETELTVSGISSSLLVRDKPSVEDGEILERLKNGNIVIWKGEMQFSEVNDDHRIEPWVKITTESGVEGWSRLFYLHPESYEDIAFQVIR